MNDLRLALRSLRNRPLFAAVAIVTLALGIGATTTLFTIVNAVLLRPLPYPDAGRIVSISENLGGPLTDEVVAAPDYFEWAKAARSFDALAAYGGASMVFTGRGQPVQLDGGQVSAGFFDVLGARPALGRAFRPDEDVPAAPGVVVLSHELWRERFAGDSSVLGSSIALDGTSYTVIGVMPAGFEMPRSAQYWIPRRLNPTPPKGVTFFAQVIGRLKPGVTTDQARAELTRLNRDVQLLGPPDLESNGQTVVMTLHERMFGNTRPALLMLLGAVGFLLLIACANVANLFLTRATARRRELAVRVALGATRWRLARQLLLESLLVAAAGGALGLLIPIWSVAYFVRISPQSVARVRNIHVDGPVLLFALGVSVLTGILFGLIPAITATRADALASLKEGGARTTGTAGQRAARQALVVGELALALLLLTGAGLLTRSFAHALEEDPGFRADHLLTASLYLRGKQYGDPKVATQFFEQWAARVRALPGVQDVGYADAPLLGGYRMTVQLTSPESTKPAPPISIVLVGPGFMRAIGLELVAGRYLTDADRVGAPAAIVLSASAAHVLFPAGSPVGQTVNSYVLSKSVSGRPTVVGVVQDLREPGTDQPRLPQLYASLAQDPDQPYLLAVRYTGSAAPLETAIRHIVAQLDPMQLELQVSTMNDRISQYVAPRRFDSVVIDVFAALALVLAAVGLYGVMAYQVAQRTQELGIRMALGADRERVLRFVLREGMGLAVLGTACGIALSLGLSRFLAGMLFGVSARDLPTFSVVPAVLILVALVACYLPARRATKVDPMVALRYE